MSSSISDPSRLGAAAVGRAPRALFDAVVRDNAAAVNQEIRCVRQGDVGTDPLPWQPVPRASGIYYPKRGDRAIVGYPVDGPPVIVDWWPATNRPPDVPAPVPLEGGADTNYVHNQEVAATLWLITHSLGKVPSIDLYGPDGSQIEGDVRSVTTTTATVEFVAATSGKAVLN